jgi:hypothetical protein
MEMRFVVPRAASASALADRLRLTFGAERISLVGDWSAVDVRVEGESDRTVIRALEIVERWLHQAAVGSAEMWLGKGCYRVASWAPAKWWQ